MTTPTRVLLVASGDLRQSADVMCWPAQAEMEVQLSEAVRGCAGELQPAAVLSSTTARFHLQPRAGDGDHTRRLAFGDIEDFSYFMGDYFFIKVVPTTALLPANIRRYSACLAERRC